MNGARITHTIVDDSRMANRPGCPPGGRRRRAPPLPLPLQAHRSVTVTYCARVAVTVNPEPQPIFCALYVTVTFSAYVAVCPRYVEAQTICGLRRQAGLPSSSPPVVFQFLPSPPPLPDGSPPVFFCEFSFKVFSFPPLSDFRSGVCPRGLVGGALPFVVVGGGPVFRVCRSEWRGLAACRRHHGRPRLLVRHGELPN